MTSLPFFQVDAFADKPLTGNPAAVMPLERWLDDSVMQAIAGENNLSETAFTVPSDSDDFDYDLRWFTPAAEVELCGHATIASAHVMAAIPNFFRQEFMLEDVPWRDTVLSRPLPVSNGYFHLDETPGLGFDLNEEESARHPGVRSARPGFYI